jgi:hypothetical protein
MKIAIMQPTFLPWLGFFSLIQSVDKFVFLDDVQFDKRSWQQRNYILSDKKPHLLTVPVMSKGKVNQKINEVRVDNTSNFKRKHLSSLHHAYSKTPFFANATSIIQQTYMKEIQFLSDFNIDLISNICTFIDMKTEFIRSSKLNLAGEKDDKLIEICKVVNASQYVTVQGSLTYLNEKKFARNKIDLKVFKFLSDKNLILPSGYSLSAIHYMNKFGPNYRTVLEDFVHLAFDEI